MPKPIKPKLKTSPVSPQVARNNRIGGAVRNVGRTMNALIRISSHGDRPVSRGEVKEATQMYVEKRTINDPNMDEVIGRTIIRRQKKLESLKRSKKISPRIKNLIQRLNSSKSPETRKAIKQLIIEEQKKYPEIKRQKRT